MTEQTIQKVGRIDQIVRDYFLTSDSKEVLAKDLMPLFIEKEIFIKDLREGLPIRNILRMLDKENKLHLLKHVTVVRNTINRNWYFKNI